MRCLQFVTASELPCQSEQTRSRDLRDRRPWPPTGCRSRSQARRMSVDGVAMHVSGFEVVVVVVVGLWFLCRLASALFDWWEHRQAVRNRGGVDR